MVCEVCSTDRTDDELRVLDYPRWAAAEVPCLNCGGLIERENARLCLPVLDYACVGLPMVADGLPAVLG